MKRKAKSASGTLSGSAEAKRSVHAMLEVLAGLKSPSQAARALSISLPRYYVLETRALEGMLKALEPREKGKRSASLESRLEAAEKERDRLRGELERMRSLVRAAQRTVGLPSAPPQREEKKGGRKKRKVNRTRKVLSRLGDGTREAGERIAEAPVAGGEERGASVPRSPVPSLS